MTTLNFNTKNAAYNGKTYLYLKTHNKTGLNYLGQTYRNPHQYKGSGYRWLNHLKVHGNDVSTRILKECLSEQELKQWCLIYSRLFNVVDNPKFANLVPEEGNTVRGALGKKYNFSEEHKKKLSEATKKNPTKFWKGKKFSEEHINKLSASRKGRKVWNKGKKGLQVAWNKGLSMTEEHKQKLRKPKRKKNHGSFTI